MRRHPKHTYPTFIYLTPGDLFAGLVIPRSRCKSNGTSLHLSSPETRAPRRSALRVPCLPRRRVFPTRPQGTNKLAPTPHTSYVIPGETRLRVVRSVPLLPGGMGLVTAASEGSTRGDQNMTSYIRGVCLNSPY